MTYTVTFADVQPVPVAVVQGRVEPENLTGFLGAAFADVMAAAAAQQAKVVGPPFGRYRQVAGGWEVTAGFPVSGTLQDTGRVRYETLPGGRVARTVHRGPYDEIGPAYEATEAYAVENRFEPAGQPWEVYLDAPDVPEPRTEVFLPCRPVAAHEPPGGTAPAPQQTGSAPSAPSA